MRNAFRGLAKTFQDGIRWRRILGPAIQIFFIWLLLMVFYYVGVEIIIAL